MESRKWMMAISMLAGLVFLPVVGCDDGDDEDPVGVALDQYVDLRGQWATTTDWENPPSSARLVCTLTGNTQSGAFAMAGYSGTWSYNQGTFTMAFAVNEATVYTGTMDGSDKISGSMRNNQGNFGFFMMIRE